MVEPITYPEYPDYMQAVKPSCSNCQFWADYQQPEVGICKKIPHEQMARFTDDDSGFFYTHKDFFCVLHELKAEGE